MQYTFNLLNANNMDESHQKARRYEPEVALCNIVPVLQKYTTK